METCKHCGAEAGQIHTLDCPTRPENSDVAAEAAGELLDLGKRRGELSLQETAEIIRKVIKPHLKESE